MKRNIELPENITVKKIIILAVILIFLAVTIYFNFFYAKKCSNTDCFNSALAKCKRAEFISTKENSVWLYTIKGSQGGKCLINVKNIKVGIEEAKSIEGNTMKCYLPLRVVMAPESDLDACHGILKEELQNILIERMHTYIVQNIGQISETLKTPL